MIDVVYKIKDCVYAGAGSCLNTDMIEELEKERDEAVRRSNEVHAALAHAFTALHNISLLTRLEGEVDDYEDVVEAVREAIR